MNEQKNDNQIQSVTIQTITPVTILSTGNDLIDEDLVRMLIQAQRRVSERCARIGRKGGKTTQARKRQASQPETPTTPRSGAI